MKVNGKCRILMAAYYALNCVVLSYVTYYLGSIGLSDLFISLVVGCACATGGVMQVVAGRVADQNARWNWKRLLILFGLCELVLAVSRIFIHLTEWQWFSYGLMIVFLLLMMPMVNLASFYYSSRGIPVNFGIARGIGSAVFAAASFLIGKLAGMLGSSCIPGITTVLSAVFLIAVLWMPEIRMPEESEMEVNPVNNSENRMPMKDFLTKYPVFFNMVTGLALLLVFHNMLNTFFIRIVESVDGDSRSLGIALAVAAIAELPVLFLYNRISDGGKRSSGSLLVAACGFYVVRGFLYLFAVNVIMIYLIQLLQSVSFGLMVVAKATYADECMEPEDKTTGQALMSFTDAFGSVAGTLVGGLLINQGGIRMMLWGGVFFAVAGTVITLYARIRERKQ